MEEAWQSENGTPQPAPLQCSKCWASCPCVRWADVRRDWDAPPSPWEDLSDLYRCPVHGYFELVDGKQAFDHADCWATGPNGEPMRLFEPPPR